MDTIILRQPGRFELIDAPLPPPPAPGEALVRVRRVGICGTDWHAYHGRQPFFTYPRILGHELGVEVLQINDPRLPVRPGDRCAVEPYLHCGKCIACRAGKTNCCVALRVLGVHIDGGMRQCLLVPADKLHKSETLSLDQLALVETLAIGCHAVNRAAVQQGEWVLVVGAGPIGLSAMPFVAEAGGHLIVADVSPARLDFCRRWIGVQHCIDARQDLAAALAEITCGDLPTLVLDATGNAQSMARTFDCVAHGGRIVFVGLFQGELSFNDPDFHRREITLLASRNAQSGDFSRIIDLIQRGRIDTRPWITHRAQHTQFVQTLPKWLAPDAGVLKAVVEFPAT